MSDIFISHVEENSNLAIEIAEGLEAHGYSSWYYERDSLPGPSYLLQTSREIEHSQAVVLIISPDSLSSNQVAKEVIRAHESGKPFLPALKSITQVEFASRQPEWKEAVGSAASISIPRKGASAIIPTLVERLQGLGIEPGDDDASDAAASYRGTVSKPKKPLFRIGSLKVSPVAAIIAALVILSLITGGLALAARDSKDPGSSEASSKLDQEQLVLRPRTNSGDADSSAQPVADSGETPVATREVKTSAGTLLIEGVKASDRFMECPMSGTGRCTQRAGGKFILGITFRSADGTSAAILQRELSSEALSSHVKTASGNRVQAFNFDLTSGKSSITVIYAYMDAGITSGLVLYWRGNPPIAIQSGSSGSSSGTSSSDTGGESGSSGSSADDGSFVDEPDPAEEFPAEEPPPEEEPPPDEPPPYEEPPPDEEPPPYEEPPPDEEPPPE